MFNCSILAKGYLLYPLLRCVSSVKRKLTIGIICAAAALIIALAAIYFIGSSLEPDIEQRGVMSEDFGTFEKLTVNGKTYRRKAGLTSVLLMGVDQDSDSSAEGYRSGGQADFILLLVSDSTAKTVHLLQIDRDTMTDVVMLSILGKRVGTRVTHLCLAHGFGKDEAERRSLTKEAVENLLQGESIDFTVSINLDAIAAFNDALGGVTVTLNDDLSLYDPAMTKGTTLTLQGRQAEYMVRSRYKIADGSNEKRMTRQLTYMNAAMTSLREHVSQSSSFLNELFDRMGDSLTTDMSRGRMINEFNKAYQYTVTPVQYLSGEYKMGSNGFMEFWPEEQSIIDWILATFYEAL